MEYGWKTTRFSARISRRRFLCQNYLIWRTRLGYLYPSTIRRPCVVQALETWFHVTISKTCSRRFFHDPCPPCISWWLRHKNLDSQTINCPNLWNLDLKPRLQYLCWPSYGGWIEVSESYCSSNALVLIGKSSPWNPRPKTRCFPAVSHPVSVSLKIEASAIVVCIQLGPKISEIERWSIACGFKNSKRFFSKYLDWRPLHVPTQSSQPPLSSPSVIQILMSSCRRLFTCNKRGCTLKRHGGVSLL